MKRIVAIVLAVAASPITAWAETLAASEPLVPAATTEEFAPRGAPNLPYLGADVTLEQFQWVARPLVVFADSVADPAFQRQIELLLDRPQPLADRDIVVIVDTDPAASSAVRTALRPRGFSLVVMGKEGEVITRKPSPWDVREITRAIDRTPLMQQELRDRRLSGR